MPVDYENNKKAWMTSSIYESWLRKLDRRFVNQKRKILMFVDNCPSHSKSIEELKAIRVVFFTTKHDIEAAAYGPRCHKKPETPL